jgi:hypothetical protein
MPMCFNLFGDLAADRAAARNAVTAWWPDAPAGQVRLRFEHSPGRRDPSFLDNRSAFDAAFEIDAGSGHAGIIGVETKYHEHPQRARLPKPAALARYIEVAERSGIFVDGWREKLLGTSLQQIWLDHLLVLAMLQHPSRKWIWGRFVLVFPSANPSYASVAGSYASLLRDSATFQVRTLEALLDASVVRAAEFRSRYLW